jgi:long-chain fatty acid transport protein
MIRRSAGTLLASAAIVALTAGAAHAGAFSSRQQSVVGAGQAYAGVAAPGIGLSGMFWNPAVVTSMPGRNSEWNLFGVAPQTRVQNVTFGATSTVPALSAGALAAMNGRGNAGEVGTSLLTTASYNNFQINQNLFIGLSVNAPYGSGTNPGLWGGSWDITRSRVFSVNVQPVVGYKINDQFSVAVGAQIQHLRFTQEQGIAPFGASASALGQVTGTDWGLGFTAGLTFTPAPGTSFGIGYRSAVDHTLKGTQSYGANITSPVTGAVLIPAGGYNISADISTPQSVTFSARQQIGAFSISGTVEWRDWSSLGVIPIRNSPTGSSLTLNYRDGWFYSIGADWRAADNLTVRAGIGYEMTPVRDQFRTLTVPDSNRLWLGAGLTWDVTNSISISGSYTYIHFASERITRSNTYIIGAGALPPGTPPQPLTTTWAGDTRASAHIFGVSARIRWDAPPPSAQPVVARF